MALAGALLLMLSTTFPARAGEFEQLASMSAAALLEAQRGMPGRVPVCVGVQERGWTRTIERIEFFDLDQPAGASQNGILHLYTPKVLFGWPGPLILVLPMTGDPEHWVSRQFCELFTRDGFRCAYLERKIPKGSALPQDVAGLFQLPGLPPGSALRARRSLDVLAEAGRLRPGERVGVAGVSLGAIDAALLAAWDPRVGAAALLLGGGDLPEILSRIDGAGVRSFVRIRERVMRAGNLTPEGFRDMVAKTTRAADPLTYYRDSTLKPAVNALAPERFLMINVAGDTAIPNEASDGLFSALAQNGSHPDYEKIHLWPIPVKARHVGGILAMPYAQRRMSDHFRRFLTSR